MEIKTVSMNLKIAEKSDLDKFRQMGFMYFLWDPEFKTFDEHPIYIHRNTDWKKFFDAFNLRQIYIPMNFFEVQFINENYEKKI